MVPILRYLELARGLARCNGVRTHVWVLRGHVGNLMGQVSWRSNLRWSGHAARLR
jgi:hypothetical protein